MCPLLLVNSTVQFNVHVQVLDGVHNPLFYGLLDKLNFGILPAQTLLIGVPGRSEANGPIVHKC